MTHSWMHSIPSAKTMVHIKEHRGMDSQDNTGVWTKTLERRSKTVAEEDLLIVTNSHHQVSWRKACNVAHQLKSPNICLSLTEKSLALKTVIYGTSLWHFVYIRSSLYMCAKAIFNRSLCDIMLNHRIISEIECNVMFEKKLSTINFVNSHHSLCMLLSNS